MSDLHLEFEENRKREDRKCPANQWDFQFKECAADVLVLAGDIYTKARALDWLKWVSAQIPGTSILYVLGNHEYWGTTYPKLITEFREATQGTSIHLLENQAITLGNVNFLGCTLWTDFNLFGRPQLDGYFCQQYMNDYRKIRRAPNYAKMRSIDTSNIHAQSLAWLSRELIQREGQTNVVITHHAPSAQSAAPENKVDSVSAAYASPLEAFIKEHRPDIWIHGHMHCSSDYGVEGCRVLCNPKGYPGEENPKFEALAHIEIS